jgi:hypothetical protein
MRVNVTWVYLSRALEFEKRLPPDLRALVQPAKDADDPSSLVNHGPFDRFPHYPTSDLFGYTMQQANMLTHLTCWVVQQNAAHFGDL